MTSDIVGHSFKWNFIPAPRKNNIFEGQRRDEVPEELLRSAQPWGNLRHR